MSKNIEYTKYIIIWLFLIIIMKYIFNDELSLIDMILMSTFLAILLAIFECIISIKY